MHGFSHAEPASTQDEIVEDFQVAKTGRALLSSQPAYDFLKYPLIDPPIGAEDHEQTVIGEIEVLLGAVDKEFRIKLIKLLIVKRKWK